MKICQKLFLFSTLYPIMPKSPKKNFPQFQYKFRNPEWQGFGIRFRKICFKKFVNFELWAQVCIKIKKKLKLVWKKSSFSLIRDENSPMTWWESLQRIYFFAIFCLFFWHEFLFLQQTIYGLFSVAFVNLFIYLEYLHP